MSARIAETSDADLLSAQLAAMSEQIEELSARPAVNERGVARREQEASSVPAEHGQVYDGRGGREHTHDWCCSDSLSAGGVVSNTPDGSSWRVINKETRRG